MSFSCQILRSVLHTRTPCIIWSVAYPSSVVLLLPQPPLSSLPSHLLVLDSVGPCGGAPLPAITWYWVNWVTLITSWPRISRQPAELVERKPWPSLITAAPAYLHNLRPCCAQIRSHWCVWQRNERSDMQTWSRARERESAYVRMRLCMGWSWPVLSLG